MSKDRGKKPDVKDDERKTLGERLRDAREYLGFSQEEVAKYLDVSRSALSTASYSFAAVTPSTAAFSFGQLSNP